MALEGFTGISTALVADGRAYTLRRMRNVLRAAAMYFEVIYGLLKDCMIGLQTPSIRLSTQRIQTPPHAGTE